MDSATPRQMLCGPTHHGSRRPLHCLLSRRRAARGRRRRGFASPPCGRTPRPRNRAQEGIDECVKQQASHRPLAARRWYATDQQTKRLSRPLPLPLLLAMCRVDPRRARRTPSHLNQHNLHIDVRRVCVPAPDRSHICASVQDVYRSCA